MRTINFIFNITLLCSFTIHAQQTCGIYQTVSDYENEQLSITGNCKFGKKSVQISDFFLRPYIFIQSDECKIKFHQDSIYAVKSCEGNIYRIWNQKAYQILDTGNLCIYSLCYCKTVKLKTCRGYKYKSEKVINYYFSENDSCDILPLTLTNVRLALLADKDLDKKLVQKFIDDKYLHSKINNKFLINDFLDN